MSTITSQPNIDADDLTMRAVRAAAKRKPFDPDAGRALLEATEDLTLCCALSWERLRQRGATTEQLFAEMQKIHFHLVEARERNQILTEHLADREPRRRHHYSPALRFRILEHMRKFLLTTDDAARRFCVTQQTIYNWLAELKKHPEATTVGSLLKPTPPLRRICDAVRRLCRHMKALGFGGKDKIAEILVRQCWKVSPRSVGRFVKEKPVVADPDPPTEPVRPRPTTVRGEYPNHLCLMDITRVPLIFSSLYFHVAAVLDAYSRLPLAVEFFFLEPSAPAMVTLLKRAIRTHGHPRHLVVDQGAQFTAPRFLRFLRTQGILARHGKVGEFHSVGLIDRFFRTLKESLRSRELRPWNPWEFRRRLDRALMHYCYVRPHAALGGLTPIEVYYNIRRHLPHPAPAPRGRAGEPGPTVPFDFCFLDPERQALPILVPRVA